MKKLNRIGEKHITNDGYEVEITEYINAHNCSIQFESGLILNGIIYAHLNNGRIKNPLHPLAYDVGYFGVGEYSSKINGKLTDAYITWRGMLERCYSEKYQEQYPTYKNCILDERWYNFQIFAKWFEENYIESFDLDKDILIKGNKIYSPENCCFVHKDINKLFTKCNNLRGKYPIGVTKKGNKFQATLSINNKTTYLGCFDTIEEAFQTYKIAKEENIKKIANKYKHQITKACYQALINYKVNIND